MIHIHGGPGDGRRHICGVGTRPLGPLVNEIANATPDGVVWGPRLIAGRRGVGEKAKPVEAVGDHGCTVGGPVLDRVDAQGSQRGPRHLELDTGNLLGLAHPQLLREKLVVEGVVSDLNHLVIEAEEHVVRPEGDALRRPGVGAEAVPVGVAAACPGGVGAGVDELRDVGERLAEKIDRDVDPGELGERDPGAGLAEDVNGVVPCPGQAAEAGGEFELQPGVGGGGIAESGITKREDEVGVIEVPPGGEAVRPGPGVADEEEGGVAEGDRGGILGGVPGVVEGASDLPGISPGQAEIDVDGVLGDGRAEVRWVPGRRGGITVCAGGVTGCRPSAPAIGCNDSTSGRTGHHHPRPLRVGGGLAAAVVYHHATPCRGPRSPKIRATSRAARSASRRR